VQEQKQNKNQKKGWKINWGAFVCVIAIFVAAKITMVPKPTAPKAGDWIEVFCCLADTLVAPFSAEGKDYYLANFYAVKTIEVLDKNGKETNRTAVPKKVLLHAEYYEYFGMDEWKKGEARIIQGEIIKPLEDSNFIIISVKYFGG
jgi:hypothetical protein